MVEADGVHALDGVGRERQQAAHAGAAQYLGGLGGEAVAVQGDDGRGRSSAQARAASTGSAKRPAWSTAV
ncbi:hypothetical protein WKI68_41125 [Streptomyces sp. MS1.HAVA.3]|uniref:Uncharacterized protein n=1 Tax=Streptomyces caledonius TaxID=3134107 RepID=A0ABU8UDC2_9ACTN